MSDLSSSLSKRGDGLASAVNVAPHAFIVQSVHSAMDARVCDEGKPEVRRRHWGRGMPAAGVFLAALLDANPALSQDYFFDVAGGGVFVGYGLGSGGGSVTWGVEAYTSRSDDVDGCSSQERTAWGPLARFTLQGLSRPLFSLGAHVGKETERAVLGLNLEGGITLGFPRGLEADAVLSPFSAVGADIVVVDLYTRHYWLLDTYPIGLSFRPIPTYGFAGSCVEGRPQRDDAGCRSATIGAPQRRTHSHAERLASDFADAACEEYESVPALLRLVTELAFVGAPRSLIERARRAVDDELRHTSICTALARRAGWRGFTPPVPVAVQRNPLSGRAGVERLALESWLDGCLGEGLAAALAADDAALARDPGLATARAVIAEDEQRHAELAWDILQWCHEQHPSVGELLRTVRDAPVTVPARRTGELRRREGIAQRHRMDCRRRLAALL